MRRNNIENSMFFRANMKIQKSLWKPYTIVLLLSFIVIVVKGIS